MEQSISFSSHEKDVTAFVQMLDTVAETGINKAVNAFEVLMAGGRKYEVNKKILKLKNYRSCGMCLLA